MNTLVVPVYKGDGLLEYEERPVPQPDHPGDVLVKIESCGICGTDLNVLALPPAHKATPNIIIRQGATRKDNKRDARLDR